MSGDSLNDTSTSPIMDVLLNKKKNPSTNSTIVERENVEADDDVHNHSENNSTELVGTCSSSEGSDSTESDDTKSKVEM